MMRYFLDLNSHSLEHRFRVIFSIVCLAWVAGCASSGPKTPALAARVVSEPEGLTVMLNGRAVGMAPVNLGLKGLDDAAGLTLKNVDDNKILERRIQILTPSSVRVILSVREEPSELAKVLGLEDILVFDYGQRASFEVDSWELEPSIVPLLQNQARVLSSRFAEVDAFVCGHTDASGEKDHNDVLSFRRAQSVADLLISHGLDPKRLKVQGFSSDYPLAPNDTPKGRALNRRTEIVIGQ